MTPAFWGWVKRKYGPIQRGSCYSSADAWNNCCNPQPQLPSLSNLNFWISVRNRFFFFFLQEQSCLLFSKLYTQFPKLHTQNASYLLQNESYASKWQRLFHNSTFLDIPCKQCCSKSKALLSFLGLYLHFHSIFKSESHLLRGVEKYTVNTDDTVKQNIFTVFTYLQSLWH